MHPPFFHVQPRNFHCHFPGLGSPLLIKWACDGLLLDLGKRLTLSSVKGQCAPQQPEGWMLRDIICDAVSFSSWSVEKKFPSSFSKHMLIKVRWNFRTEIWPLECEWKWLSVHGQL